MPETAKRVSNAGAEVNRRSADEFAKRMAPVIAEIQANGVTQLKGIAAELNARGIPPPRRGAWHKNTVRRVLARLEPPPAG
jgi:hypothetical protein